MIDPALYMTAKANNTVTLGFDGTTYTITLQQFDTNSGQPIDPIIETYTINDVNNAIAAANTALANIQNTINGFTPKLQQAQTTVNNLTTLQADLLATPQSTTGPHI